MSSASESRSSSLDKAYRSSLLGMPELRNDWKKAAMTTLGAGDPSCFRIPSLSTYAPATTVVSLHCNQPASLQVAVKHVMLVMGGGGIGYGAERGLTRQLVGDPFVAFVANVRGRVGEGAGYYLLTVEISLRIVRGEQRSTGGCGVSVKGKTVT